MFSSLRSAFGSIKENAQTFFQPKLHAATGIADSVRSVTDAVDGFADRIGSVLDSGKEMLSLLSPKNIQRFVSDRVSSLFIPREAVPVATSRVAAVDRPVVLSPARPKGRLDDVRLELPSLHRRPVTPMGWAPGKTYSGMFKVQMAPTLNQILDLDPLSPFHQFDKVGLMDETPVLDGRSMFHQTVGEQVRQTHEYYDHAERLNTAAFRDMLPPLTQQAPVSGLSRLTRVAPSAPVQAEPVRSTYQFPARPRQPQNIAEAWLMGVGASAKKSMQQVADDVRYDIDRTLAMAA